MLGVSKKFSSTGYLGQNVKRPDFLPSTTYLAKEGKCNFVTMDIIHYFSIRLS